MRQLLLIVMLLGSAVPPLFAQTDTNTPTRDEMAAAIAGIGGAAPAQTTFIVSGGQVAWVSAYQFSVSAASYYILGVPYTSAEQTITLSAADMTNDRIDVVGLDNTGTVFKITGTAAAQASEPDIDPGTQLKLVIVHVGAGTSAPTGAAASTVYADNAGSPTEWDCTTSGSGFNCNSTNNPRGGSSKDIEGTTVAAGDYAQLAIGTGSVDPSSESLLILFIRSKATWATKRGLQLSLRSAGVIKGNIVTINRTGSFGFDSSVTGTYQQVAIPISQFGVSAGTTITQVRITGFGGSIGFYVDDVSLQSGAVVITPDYALTDLSNVQTTATPQLARLGLGCAPDATAPFKLCSGQNIIVPYSIGNSSTSFAVNWNNGPVQYVTLTGNVTSVTFSNGQNGGRYLLYVLTGAGSFTVTGWDAAVLWPGGTAPTITTTASKVDLITFGYLSGATKYYGSFNQNY